MSDNDRKVNRVMKRWFTCRSLSDISYSDECLKKTTYQYALRMFPLFRAIVKSCSNNGLFTYFCSSKVQNSLDQNSPYSLDYSRLC